MSGRSRALQQARGGEQIVSFEPFTELLVDRSEQSGGPRPAPGRYPARCKIGGYAQLKGLRPYRARLNQCLL
jgi:hypothetical protein